MNIADVELKDLLTVIQIDSCQLRTLWLQFLDPGHPEKEYTCMFQYLLQPKLSQTSSSLPALIGSRTMNLSLQNVSVLPHSWQTFIRVNLPWLVEKQPDFHIILFRHIAPPAPHLQAKCPQLCVCACFCVCLWKFVFVPESKLWTS